jgi:hypothetical protein
MFERARFRVGLAYTRFVFRANREQVIRWTGAVSGARKALLIMPESSQNAAAVRSVVEYFVKRFSPTNLVVVARPDVATQFTLDRGAQLITLAPTDITTWYLPRRELTQKLKKSTFDIAIDMNLEVKLPSAYLCRASDARIRIGFDKQYAETFYNFQVRPKLTTDFGAACNGLIDCLKMF